MAEPDSTPIRVGDRLLVVEPRWRASSGEPIEAEVTKAPPVWLEMTEVRAREGFRPRTWKLRRDTQDDGGEGHSRTHFLTPEQFAQRQRRAAVNAYLAEVGIRTERDKPWNDEEHRIVLANLLRQHEGLPAL
ncbi:MULTISPECIES: beta barrel domain-containing protein [Streptomyces]|uniref:beta barrel domain-containing protein n=1 Tax=Streptomyces TaxID=1883 RepID=UPI000E6821B8|nr:MULTISPECIES: hypothetical protein [Streptomyces]MDX3066395.1 hypothetical protein [Streptomyces sp. ND04-05B]MDX3519455.1 hypothetical protein [Streptomyces scabiei]